MGVGSLTRCRVVVYPRERGGFWRRSECGRPGKIKEGDSWFCGIHNPIRARKRRAAREAEWKRQREEAEARERRRLYEKAVVALVEEVAGPSCSLDELRGVLVRGVGRAVAT